MEFLDTLLHFNSTQFQSFILVGVRFSGLLVSAPVFSNRNIPSIVKIGLCMILSIIILPFIKLLPEPVKSNWTLFIILAKEFSVGLVIGIFITLIFVALQLAGQFIDYQTGFGLVNIIDPESRVQVPLTGQILYILAVLLFLLMGGHHLMIKSLVRSFEVIPLGMCAVNNEAMLFLNKAFAQIIIIAFKISVPVVAAVFISEMAYGVMARAIPQMNLLIVGLPLKMGLGMFMLMIVLPLFLWVMKREFFNIFASINNLFNLL